MFAMGGKPLRKVYLNISNKPKGFMVHFTLLETGAREKVMIVCGSSNEASDIVKAAHKNERVRVRKVKLIRKGL